MEAMPKLPCWTIFGAKIAKLTYRNTILTCTTSSFYTERIWMSRFTMVQCLRDFRTSGECLRPSMAFNSLCECRPRNHLDFQQADLKQTEFCSPTFCRIQIRLFNFLAVSSTVFLPIVAYRSNSTTPLYPSEPQRAT